MSNASLKRGRGDFSRSFLREAKAFPTYLSLRRKRVGGKTFVDILNQICVKMEEDAEERRETMADQEIKVYSTPT